TASDQATESLTFTGDYWRQMATTSPHLARRQSRTSPGDFKILAWRQARRIGCFVAV
ncbi:hypothetical protein A2U01_0119646, partial [Trifolium medium]|nr:hypothetical protein [Trifolium medium]